MLKKIIFAAALAAVVLAAVFADSISPAQALQTFPESISVYIPEKNQIEQMTFDRFCEGCLCGIIPKTGNIYDLQTLSAAAVIINTNALFALENNEKKFGADIVKSEEFPYISYSDKAVDLADRKVIRAAVKAAKNTYLAHENKPVRVKMCAISSGKTKDLLFMPSRELPEDALAKGYLTERAFSQDEILSAFSMSAAEVAPSEWFSDPVYDEYGALMSIDLVGKRISGGELRGALGLKSDAITVEYSFETFVFRCKGSGDNAGMSLNAANVAAASGKNFTEILSEFYRLELV